MANSLMESFNKGKAVEILESESSVDTQKLILEITQVMMREDEKNKDDAGNPSLYFEIEVTDIKNPKNSTQLRQYVKMDDEGKLKNPAYKSFTGRDGTIVPASIVGEILEKAKLLNPEDYEERKTATAEAKGRRWKEMLEGMKFEIECVGGNKKDGSGTFLIPLTQYQKARDLKKNPRAINTTVGTTGSSDIVIDDLPF